MPLFGGRPVAPPLEFRIKLIGYDVRALKLHHVPHVAELGPVNFSPAAWTPLTFSYNLRARCLNSTCSPNTILIFSSRGMGAIKTSAWTAQKAKARKKG